MISAQVLHTVLILLGVFGFVVSAYIFMKKRRGQKVVCPFRGSCDRVITSRYGTFFGISLEVFGMGYYALIVLYHMLFLVSPFFSQSFFLYIHVVLSLGAVLFSLYLLGVQLFVLRTWCTWCILSMLVSIGIFGFLLTGYQLTLPVILEEFTRVSTIAHLLGVSLGLGAATITDIFFFRFLKDYKISKGESETLDVLSEVIWVALGILFISGILLFIPKADVLAESGKFLTKIVALVLLSLNGFALNLIIAPKLIELHFAEEDTVETNELKRLRRLAFALGAISLTSWYFVFVLGSLRGVTFSFVPLISIYVVLLVVAIIGSQIFGHVLQKKKAHQE
jgi:uncharacterized membrane protein